MTDTAPTIADDQVMVTGKCAMFKHFDICDSAVVSPYKDIEPSALDNVLESNQLVGRHDEMNQQQKAFEEKMIIAANLASSRRWYDKSAQHYADMIAELAEEMDLVDEQTCYYSS